MTTSRGARAAFGLVLTILLAACALAARQRQLARDQKPLKVQVEMVHLFATVRGPHGKIVSLLSKKDFRVYEDGRRQHIAYFSREMDLPLTLGLLIDTSGSQERLLDAEQFAAKLFLRQVLRPKDLAFVVTFGSRVDLLANFTNSIARLDGAIARAHIDAPLNPAILAEMPFPQLPSGTHFYDAVYLACRDKLAGQAGRKALIVLTDAQDYGSIETLADTIEAAQRSNTVVHVLLIANPWQYAYAGGYNGERVARKLTGATGGRLIPVTSGPQLLEAFKTLAVELRRQYVIGYYPTNPVHNGSFRRIRIKTTDGHDHVLTRSGYYAPSN